MFLPSSSPWATVSHQVHWRSSLFCPGPVQGAVCSLGRVPSEGSVCAAEQGADAGSCPRPHDVAFVSRVAVEPGTACVPKACWNIAGTLNKATRRGCEALGNRFCHANAGGGPASPSPAQPFVMQTRQGPSRVVPKLALPIPTVPQPSPLSPSQAY